MQVTLRQIEVFAMVAKYRNFTQAGRVLHMTQPAVSAQLKKVEQALGVKLVEIIHKKVLLTDAGEEFLKHVQNIQKEIEHLGVTVSKLKDIKAGKVSIALPFNMERFGFQSIAAFTKKFPDIEINVMLGDRISKYEYLKEELVDIVIQGPPAERTPFESTHLYDFHCVLIAPMDHPLAKVNQTLTKKELINQSFIVGEEFASATQIFEKHFMHKSLRTINLNSDYAVQFAVEAGLGIAVVDQEILEPSREGLTYKVLDVEGLPVKIGRYALHRNTQLLSPAAQMMLEFLKEYYAHYEPDRKIKRKGKHA